MPVTGNAGKGWIGHWKLAITSAPAACFFMDCCQ